MLSCILSKLCSISSLNSTSGKPSNINDATSNLSHLNTMASMLIHWPNTVWTSCKHLSIAMSSQQILIVSTSLLFILVIKLAYIDRLINHHTLTMMNVTREMLLGYLYWRSYMRGHMKKKIVSLICDTRS